MQNWEVYGAASAVGLLDVALVRSVFLFLGFFSVDVTPPIRPQSANLSLLPRFPTHYTSPPLPPLLFPPYGRADAAKVVT